MARIVEIAFFICLVVTLSSCKKPTEAKPIWENVKITDLSSAQTPNGTGLELIKTANFEVYIIEIPQTKLTQLNDIWSLLNEKRIIFTDYQAFRANSLLAGSARFDALEQIDSMFRDASGKTINRFTLLIYQGQTQDVELARLKEQQSIFYISTDGSMTGTTVGPGYTGLRLRPEKVFDYTGVCNLEVTTVFSTPYVIPLDLTTETQKKSEFLFEPVTFKLIMRPGDFFILGPEKLNTEQSTLDGILFTIQEPNPAVIVCLILCTGVLF